jgi:hypothetical protein
MDVSLAGPSRSTTITSPTAPIFVHQLHHVMNHRRRVFVFGIAWEPVDGYHQWQLVVVGVEEQEPELSQVRAADQCPDPGFDESIGRKGRRAVVE